MGPPHLDDGDVRLYLGDCIEVMAEMDAESVDAVVTDPPYGIRFMGQAWDGAEIARRAKRAEKNKRWPNDGSRRTVSAYSYSAAHAGGYDFSVSANAAFAIWCQTWATEALRVLKPGGHLLAFGGPRTFHRLTCGLEDAGFEIRDCLMYLYGSGFPKSLDVSKAIDREAGAERPDRTTSGYGGNKVFSPSVTVVNPGDPVTDSARQWQGWGTALKPAWEPVVVARKPLIGTVAQNVERHGTGALNIDGCRVGTEGGTRGSNFTKTGLLGIGARDIERLGVGRWPANIVLDEEAARLLDEQSGNLTSGTCKPGFYDTMTGPVYNDSPGYRSDSLPGSSGGASRFFYTAKTSPTERDGVTHPTVKPLDPMRWLVRLVTPPGGLVLDPFGGSGTTGLACRQEGLHCILIEREREYCDMIAHRLRQLSLLAETGT